MKLVDRFWPRLTRRRASRFRVHDGALEITDDGGRVVWHGRPDELAVEDSRALEDGSGAILLLDSDHVSARRQNLVRVDSRGAIVWRADLPGDEVADAYLEMELEPQHVKATSWSGYRVAVDPSTGRVVKREFVK